MDPDNDIKIKCTYCNNMFIVFYTYHGFEWPPEDYYYNCPFCGVEVTVLAFVKDQDKECS